METDNKAQQILDKTLAAAVTLRRAIEEKFKIYSDKEKDTTDKQNKKSEDNDSDAIKKLNQKIVDLDKFVKSEIDKNKKLINQVIKPNENKEKQIVEKTKPVYIDSFGERAITSLNDIFQKVFNIQVIQPKEDHAKSSKLWVTALIGIIGIIILYFDKIKNFIQNIDWEKIWSMVKTILTNSINKLWPEIVNILKSSFNVFIDSFAKIINSKGIQDAIQSVKNFFIPADFIKDISSAITNFFTDVVPNMFKSVITGLKSFMINIFNFINQLFGFKFIDIGKNETDKADTIKAEEYLEQTNEEGQNPSIPNISNSNESDQDISKIDPNIAIANNMTNFNKISGGAIDKSISVSGGDNTTYLTPLHKDDNAVILKEDGLIDKRLNNIIDNVSTSSKEYLKKFDVINDTIVKQNDIISKLPISQKQELAKIIDNNNEQASKYINANVKLIYSDLNKLRTPVIEQSNINTLRYTYINE